MTHQHRETGDGDEYATPPSLWRPLARAVGGFDVDPCSGAESTPIAPTRYTAEEDGLAQAWHGDVWVNPPFGDKTSVGGGKRGEWLTKARNEAARDEVRTVTVLLPVDTSTAWFHQGALEADTVCFLNHRTEFEGQDGHTSFATMLLVFGSPPDELVEALEKRGAVFRGRQYFRSTVQQSLEEVA